MAEQLSKVYEPAKTEKQANEIWINGGYFHCEPDGGGAKNPAYTIVIPPPNVTAPLHLGHALNNTLQDVLIRFHRMNKFNTLWMPGTDHAGIATQTVVEKRILAEENKRRTDFQREDFVCRIRAWKDEYQAQIISQLKAMGCSCDWQRVRFTMDDVCARAVRAAFFKLFKDGLIYRGKRLVNWDPATQTVLADDEVEHETVQGHFWYMKYPLFEAVEVDGKQITHVTVATTRPETMLGDTAVAMHPAGQYADVLVGRKVRLPIVGRIIPIIADEHVVLPDPKSDDEKARYSTGFLKVTPAHDPDDWLIGQRHGLDVINVMAPDGSISDKYGWDDGGEDAEFLLDMDRYEAREAIVEWFRKEKLLEDVREYTHEIGHSYRSHVPIEPYLSDQWYIAVKKPIEHLAEDFGEALIDATDVPANSLAGLALKPLLDGRVKFIPERYAKMYQSWLENLRDWPISRQLWWGHQIPVWSKQADKQQADDELSRFGQSVHSIQMDTEQGTVSYVCVTEDCESIEKHLTDAGWVQDEDVLDTWFSSALWPFSTLGWPQEKDELKVFYPGNVLCTAREIITLWVSRMVMMGQYCIGDIPFSDVLIHAMIQDGQGRKMSKSLGNGIDPLAVIDSHGADAMRFTLASMTTDTQDIRMPVVSLKLPDGRTANTSAKFDVGRNFCNKLWNASRFAMSNLEGISCDEFNAEQMTITDRWILSRLAGVVDSVTVSLNEYKYNEPLTVLYRFFWNDFCDWYLEWAKPRMQDERQKGIAQNVLAFVLDQILRLLHPFIPFITEGIFEKLNEVAPLRKLGSIAQAEPAKALTIAEWPSKMESLVDSRCEKEIELVQTVVRSLRDIRSKYNIAGSVRPSASANTGRQTAAVLNDNRDLICLSAGIEKFTAGELDKPQNAATAIAGDMQIYVHDVIDVEAERLRLSKQQQQLQNARGAVEAKLANENFVNKAKPEVVNAARAKLSELTGQLETINKHLADIED